MNGPEHYRKAERWLTHAESTYLDTTGEAGPREDYATHAEWMDALQESAENHERSLREAATFAAIGQGHAMLALAAANVVAFALDATSPDLDDWATLTLPSADNTELKLRKAVAALLHDTDTSPDADASAVIARFREGLPDTRHGEPVLELADDLMRAEGGA